MRQSAVLTPMAFANAVGRVASGDLVACERLGIHNARVQNVIERMRNALATISSADVQEWTLRDAGSYAADVLNKVTDIMGEEIEMGPEVKP